MLENTKFYTLDEIAEQFGVSYQLVYRMVRTGELPALRFGKNYRVSEKDLESYLQRQREVVKEEVKSQTCSRCGKTFFSSQSMTGECKVCGAPLCMNCVTLDHAEFCPKHENGTPEQK